jgi:hypothetical protein
MTNTLYCRPQSPGLFPELRDQNKALDIAKMCVFLQYKEDTHEIESALVLGYNLC